MSGMLFISGGSTYAKFVSTKTQSQANTNNCSNGTNCAITSPQTQGDGTASSPTNVQISRFNKENQDGVGVEPNPITVPVTFTVRDCVSGPTPLLSLARLCQIIAPPEYATKLFIFLPPQGFDVFNTVILPWDASIPSVGFCPPPNVGSDPQVVHCNFYHH
jgi:hypothetical protein